MPADCPADATFVDFLRGRLSRQAALAMEAHVDACEDCRRALALVAQSSVSAELSQTLERAHEEPSEPSPWPIGEVLASRFEVLRPIGRGAVSLVFEAHDRQLDQRIALKLLRPDVAQTTGADARWLERLRQEIVLGRRVSHPNVCRTFDLGIATSPRTRGAPDHDVLFITMELVQGETLAARMARQPPALDDSIDIVVQICSALDAAHAKGVVHRDVKPANIMLAEDGHVTVMDFGLASDLLRPAYEKGVALGTPAYWSPEQANGLEATQRSDLYSVGVIACELFTGRRPKPGTPSTEIFAGLASPLRVVVRRCLAVDPAKRCASARELSEALQAARVLLAGEATQEGITRGAASAAPATSPLLAQAAQRDSTDLVGRRAELSALHSLFTSGARIVTVLGAPGIGKTKISRRYASLRSTLGDQTESGAGIVQCDLTTTRTRDGICAALGDALGVPLTGDEAARDPVRLLARILATRGPMLVVLDNFEHLVDHAASTVGRLAELAPRVEWLITSRERLRLADEACFELGPLSLPDGTRSVEESEAVQLFAARARAVRPDFVVWRGNEDVVARIVTALDGLPLAIELAAARARVMSISEMADRLGNRFELLATARRDASERSATLRGAIDWSYRLLGRAEQVALAQCSVFAGSFTLSSAEAVLRIETTDDEPRSSVLDLMQSLRDKSLVTLVDGERLALYESIREYAAEKLDALGLAVGTRARHADHYIRLAERLSERVDREGGIDALRQLALERANVTTVLRRALDTVDLPRALRAVLALEPVMSRHGPTSAHLAMLDAVLARATGPGRARDARSALAPSPMPATTDVAADPRLVCKAYLHRGAALLHSDFVRSRRDLEHALEAARLLGAHDVEVRAHLALASHGLHAGELHDGVAHAESALRLVSVRPQLDVGGQARVRLGALHAEIGEPDEAIALCSEALAMARERGDRLLEAEALNGMAKAHNVVGRTPEAVAVLEQALAIFREQGDLRREGRVVGNLAVLSSEAGTEAPATVRARFDRALEIARQVGDLRMEVQSSAMRAMYDHDRGDLAEAERSYEHARALARDIGARPLEAWVTGYLGCLAHERGAFDSARELLEHAVAGLEDERFRGIFLGAQADVLHEQGALDAALPLYEKAIEIVRRVGDPRAEAIFLASMGALFATRDRVEDAAQALDAAEARLLGCATARPFAAEVRLHAGHLDLAHARAAIRALRMDDAAAWVASARARVEQARPLAETSLRVRFGARLLAAAAEKTQQGLKHG